MELVTVLFYASILSLALLSAMRGYELSVRLFRKRVLAAQEREFGVKSVARDWAEAAIEDLRKFELTPSQKVDVVISAQEARGASWELREATRKEMNSLLFGGK